jgi:uncharacterized membrane protein (UPF0127 family)
MARLKRKSDHSEILSTLGIADNIFTRTKGLLGTKSLPEGKGLWIHRCNSIHTFFMRYPIDCIFLDSDMKIVSLVPQVGPGRMVWPQFRALSVIEIAGGQLEKLSLKVGEELYVGD